jgi:MATE family multidrug resistance protein
MGTGFMAVMALGMVAGSGALPWLFLSAEDPAAPAVAASAATLLVIAGVFQLADGVQVVAAGALRGLRDTRVPMLLAAVGYWAIGLPVGLVLGFPFGLGASGSGSASPSAWRWWRRSCCGGGGEWRRRPRRREAPDQRRPRRSRPCGAAKSSAGPAGTMPVGFRLRWLSW